MSAQRQSNRRKIITSVAVMAWVALIASTTASADPQRAPAPPTNPTSVPNPQRDPVPPRAVCPGSDLRPCSAMCAGCEGDCNPPRSSTGRRNLQACDEIGRYWRSADLYLQSIPYFEAACNPGPVGVAGGPSGIIPAVAVAPFWAGCYDLGKLFLNGQGTPRDEAKARELIARACALAGPSVTYEACFALGQLAEAGTGGPKDVGVALDAYKKACDGSYPRACQAFLRLQPATHAPAPPQPTLRAPAPPHPPGTPSSIPVPPKPAPAPTGGGAGRVR